MLSDKQTLQLASDLVHRIAPKLPPGFETRSVDGEVSIESEGSKTVVDFKDIVQQPGSPQIHVERAIDGVLSAIQDFVVQQLREPWPLQTAEQAPGAELPMPEVAIAWPRIRLWFGSMMNPALTFDPIDVDLGEEDP